MSASLYLSFIAYALATTILPGPNNVLLMSEAGRKGIKKCLPLLMGIWSGLLCVMTLSAVLMSILNRIVPMITPVFKYVGAFYILYLAWKTAIRKPVGEEKEAKEERQLGFKDGFLLQFLNVKVLMLGLAAYPGYFLSKLVTWPQVIVIPIFAVSMTFCCGTGNVIWMVAGSLIRPVYDRFYRPVNIVMALLLIYCAVKIIMI